MILVYQERTIHVYELCIAQRASQQAELTRTAMQPSNKERQAYDSLNAYEIRAGYFYRKAKLFP